MQFGQLLYFISILVKCTDKGCKSDRNMYVNINIQDKAYFISVYLLVYYININIP
jgi:hypothetical protein